MDVATWNVLHDGQVTTAEGVIPGDLTLSVEIAYLCGHLPTEAKHLIVKLVSVDLFEFQPYEQSPITDPSDVANLGLEILSAEIDGGGVRIECSDGGYGGGLVLRYISAQLATAEGQILSQSEVESASDRYWSLWQQKHAKPGATADGGI